MLRTQQAEAATKANYWQQYGLKQAPFLETSHYAMYYPAPQWQQYVAELQNIATSNQTLLLLTGVLGSGKSMLLAQSATQLDDRAEYAKHKATSGLNPEKLSDMLATEFAAEKGEATLSINERLLQQLQTLQRKRKSHVLYLDDAHQLPLRTLTILLHLASQQQEKVALHIVLLAEPQLESRIKNLIEKHKITLPLETLKIKPLTIDETKHYLKHRLAKSGLAGSLPFTKTMIEQIHQLSGGVPGRINRVAQQTLISNLNTASTQEQVYFNVSQPPIRVKAVINAHRVKMLSAVLVVVSGVGLWSLQHQQTSMVSIVAENNQPIKFPTVVTKQSATLPSVVHSEPTPVAVAQPQGNNTAVVTSVAMNDTPVVASTDHAKQLDQDSAVPADKTRWGILKGENREFSPLSAKREFSSRAAFNSGRSSRFPAGTPGQDLAKVFAATSTAPEVALKPIMQPAGADAVAELNGKSYTIQLMGARNPTELTSFVAANHLTNTLIFRTTYKDAAWYVLVYGGFNTPQDARAAVAQLPQAVQQQHPWIRPVTSMQAAMQGVVGAG